MLFIYAENQARELNIANFDQTIQLLANEITDAQNL